MTESAKMGNTVLTEEAQECPRPEHVREFDACIGKALPELSREEMQHLIEHPDELKARMHFFGLQVARTYRRDLVSPRMLELWNNFYVEMFNVSPDFSRVYLGSEAKPLFTYVEPILVAPSIRYDQIIDVIKRLCLGIQSAKFDIVDLGQFGEPERMADMLASNYIAAFSPVIHERVPEKIANLKKYKNEHMSLREYLLYLAYGLYHVRVSGLVALGDSCIERCFGTFILPITEKINGRKFGDPISEEHAPHPVVTLKRDMSFYVGTNDLASMAASTRHSIFECHQGAALYPRGVRRVKLFRTPKSV